MIFPAKALIDISKNNVANRARRDDSWYGYVDGSTWGAIPFSVSYLYRGQTGHHAPMLPSIARDLKCKDVRQLWKTPASDQAKIILRLAQSWWFSRELTYHPVSSHASSQGLDLNSIALAQHYGIPTGYLDLTDDFSVAAFFATCRPTAYGWEPVESSVEVGVVYRVALETLETPFGRYEPLGPQALPRPTQQSAWVTELPLCHSFDGWPKVDILKFKHDPHVGEHFLDRFSGGDLLFPPDPLVGVADEIVACREIPEDLVDAAIESFAIDPCGVRTSQIPELRREITKLASLIGNRRLLKPQQVAPFLDDSDWCKQMLSDVRVRWRAVRRIPVSDSSEADSSE